MEPSPVTLTNSSATPAGSSRLEAAISGRVRVNSTYLAWATRRRQIARLKFSVRTLLLGTLLCGSAVGLYMDIDPWVPQRTLALLGPKGKATLFGAYSPDGRYLALAYSDATVTVFATDTGLEVLMLPEQKSQLAQLHLSPDGKRLLTATVDDTVCVWDMANGAKLLEMKNLTVRGGFSPDSLSVLVQTAAATKNMNAPRAYHWSPFVSVFDIETGACRPIPNADNASFATFSPSGKRVVVGQRDGALRLADLDGRVFGIETGQNFVEFSPDGLLMLAGSIGLNSASVLDSSTGKMLRAMTGHDGNITAARYAPNSRSIVSTGSDQCLRVWDASTCELSAVLHVGPNVLTQPGARFLDNTHVLIPRTNGTASIWVKNRPEYQLGVCMMPELWATVIFFVLTLWSIAKDQSQRYKVRVP